MAALTEREREILALVADGHTHKEICPRLGVTRSNVKNHLMATHDEWRGRSRTPAAERNIESTCG